MSTQTTRPNAVDDDVRELEKMGYKQELSRRMGGFSNFAISFSIICILAGGISAFPSALGAGGGAAIGIGWVVGALFAYLVAVAMAQIASAYPTSGAMYHWASILGGRGYGWTAAWFNLLGLIFVIASVNYGVYDPFFKSIVAPMLGMDTESMGELYRISFIALVTISQAFLNHYCLNLSKKLTDFAGYLIFFVSVALVLSLLAFSPISMDFGKLFTFTNFTGAEGSAWPQTDNMLVVFLVGLVHTIYTITGFDASAHTSEETHNAAVNVPKGVLRSVIYSAIFGYVMVASFVLVMPDVSEGVKQGAGFLGALLAPLPKSLQLALGLGILLSNYLCGLAALTSTSRMMYAFSRDGGMPFSNLIRVVNPKYNTPGAAVWVTAIAAILATVYGDAFLVLATGSVVLIYISYIMPTAAGFFAEGKTWIHKGPFNLGALSKPIAVLATLGGLVLVWVGVQPPNEKVLYLVIALTIALLVIWFAGVNKVFKGPPMLNKDMK